jgi:hypothetical protein
MREAEMDDVANFIGRALLKRETVGTIKKEIMQFRLDYQTVQYCFHAGQEGYAYHHLVE